MCALCMCIYLSRIVCSQLPANIVKKLCMVAQVEYDARHSDLVHDMTKVCVLSNHNITHDL